MLSKIEITNKTIVFVFLILAVIWLVLAIREILFLLFIAFILMAALKPLIAKLERFRIPRVIGILLTYLLVFGLLGSVIAGLIPALVSQTTKLVQVFPSFIERLMPYWDVNFQAFSQQLGPLGENILKLTLGIFSNIMTTITVLVFTFYFLLERQKLEEFLRDLFGREMGEKTASIIRKVESSLGTWLLGQLTLMLSIGIITYLGLLLLKIEYALPLAILAGLLEIVPTIGPIISAIPGIIISLTVSPVLALATAALYFLVQQLENNLLVPVVMKRIVGLPPLLTIVALMVGARLAGVAGAVLTVPIVLMIQVILKEIINKKN